MNGESARRLNILLVSQQFPPMAQLGGIGTQTAVKAAGLAKLGHVVTVLTRGAASGRTRWQGNIDVIRLPAPALNTRTVPAAWLAGSLQVAEAIDKLIDAGHPIDLIDFPEYGAEGLIWLSNRASWHHLPVAIQIHGTTEMLSQYIGWPEPGSSEHRLCTQFEHEAMRQAELVYASSSFSARFAADALDKPCEQIPVWHCGVDTKVFLPSASPIGTPLLGFVGRIAASKGIDVLLDAFTIARAQIPTLRLRLIGPVSEDGQALLDRTDIDKIEVCGARDRNELPALLSDCVAFVAPSRFEAGPGLVYLEAMACGLPVIAGDVGGIKEVVIPNVTGILLDCLSADKVAEAIFELIGNEPRRRSLSESARQWVCTHADSEQLLPRLETLYRSLYGVES